MALAFFVLPEEGKINPALVLCVDHYPPLQVIEGERVTGENVEVVKRLANRLEIELTFTPDTPFVRCIEYLKSGEIDLMVGLLWSAKRDEYAHLFLYDDLTIKTFFRHRHSKEINRFEDLEGLNIAVLRGVKQFAKFDNAPLGFFNKIEVNTLPAAFGMLNKRRVDAVAVTDYYGLQVLDSNEEYKKNIVQAAYREQSGTQVYIALSRKSRFVNYLDQFQQHTKEMFDGGEFIQIIIDFQKSHPEYYR